MSRYNAPPNADSQCGHILRLLESRRREWVPLLEILALKISQYGTRIKELRDDWGCAIENRSETVKGIRHSWFRLIESSSRGEDSDFMRRRRAEDARDFPLFAGESA